MKTNEAQFELYARCPFGLEKTVGKELESLGIKSIRPLNGGVAFFGTMKQAYQACLWLRCASRVLLVLDRFNASHADELYEGVKSFDWSQHIDEEATIAIHARGTNAQLKNTQFIAVKTKDALCDKLREQRGTRPSVQQHRPSVQLEVSLRNNKATLYLDLSGEPLHRRGYREEGKQAQAPLKENLAAGVLLESGWSGSGTAFFDPLCGSGTFVIEAAMIAADMAPNILRDYWGFDGWTGHQASLWEDILTEADDRLEHALEDMPLLVGSDFDERAIGLANNNAKRAGLSEYVTFSVAAVSEAPATLQRALQDSKAHSTLPAKGFMVTNPPYGTRLLSEEELPALYEAMRTGLTQLPQDWSVHVITADPSIDIHFSMIPYETKTLYNGKIETTLRHYEIADKQDINLLISNPVSGKEVAVPVLEKGTEQFAARLKKVAKERRKWAKREGVSCYRIYDADLPDYAVAIDRYEGVRNSKEQAFICVTEYRAPKEIDEDKARRRYHDVLQVVPEALGVASENVVSKVRERAKGGAQYGEESQDSRIMLVHEGAYRLRVDLGGHLDTGLFLDHRITRALVGTKASGKRFLNLFAYTGAATVHAAGGGAKTTTTVDMSNTYLQWAQENMRLNGFEDKIHQFIRADVLDWIKAEKDSTEKYDLIFVDPPTFSNSKKMGDTTWSVQRDHVPLLCGIASLLDTAGTIIFSCNLRGFKPDQDKLVAAGLHIEDITLQTIPEDFSRNQKIHKCYLITWDNS